MMEKIAAVLSPIAIGAVSAAGLLSRVRLVVREDTTAAAARSVATELPARIFAFMHAAAPTGGVAIAILLHAALAPVNVTLSLLEAGFRVGMATIGGVIHLAPLYLLHGM